MVRTFDLTPLLRSTVGFDHLNRLFEHAAGLNQSDVSYPPYNIEKSDEDNYRITMAVAGFKPEELEIVTQENVLYIRAAGQNEERQDVEYLHRGIAKRAFERRFELAETIKVVGASVADGLLHVDLVREVPEEHKPRQIPIATQDGRTAGGGSKAIGNKAEAA